MTVSTRLRTIAEHPSVAPGEYVEVDVADTGIGMPPEVVARAFDPFYTTKGIGKGTGLGLSQVYGMAQQAGGMAFIRSEVGVGTTVSLLLPRSTSSAQTIGPPSAPVPLQSERRRTCILVVDDDPGVRSTLESSLDVLGHHVVSAADGDSALSSLEAFEPDVLIVDFAMPGMNGAEVADRARKQFPRLPIIFVSGYADVEAIERAVGSLATLLRKPFDIEELDATVRRALRAGRDNATGS